MESTFYPLVVIIQYVPGYIFSDSVGSILTGGKIDIINSECLCAGLSMINTSIEGPSGQGPNAQQNKWMMKSAEFVQNIFYIWCGA